MPDEFDVFVGMESRLYKSYKLRWSGCYFILLFRQSLEFQRHIQITDIGEVNHENRLALPMHLITYIANSSYTWERHSQNKKTT